MFFGKTDLYDIPTPQLRAMDKHITPQEIILPIKTLKSAKNMDQIEALYCFIKNIWYPNPTFRTPF